MDKSLAASGVPEDDVRALMMRTRYAWVVVLLGSKTEQSVKMLLGEKIE